MRSIHACAYPVWLTVSSPQIRLFGDPRHGGTGVPQLSITLTVGIEDGSPLLPVIRDSSHDVVCDFVDGWAFGDAIGVGLRSLKGWWTVTDISMSTSQSEVRTHHSLAHPYCS